MVIIVTFSKKSTTFLRVWNYGNTLVAYSEKIVMLNGIVQFDSIFLVVSASESWYTIKTCVMRQSMVLTKQWQGRGNNSMSIDKRICGYLIDFISNKLLSISNTFQWNWTNPTPKWNWMCESCEYVSEVCTFSNKFSSSLSILLFNSCFFSFGAYKDERMVLFKKINFCEHQNCDEKTFPDKKGNEKAVRKVFSSLFLHLPFN